MVSTAIRPLVTLDVPVVPLVTEEAPANAVVAVTMQSALPVPASPVFEPRGLHATDFILPATCTGAWLLGVGEAVATGASLPVLLAVGGAAALSGIAVALGLVRKSNERVVVDPAAPKKPVEPKAKAASADSASTALRFALEKGNEGTIRVSNAENYAKAVRRVPADVCIELLSTMPRGVVWGYRNAASLPYKSVVAGLGLTTWGSSGFEGCDVSATILALSKLGEVTDAQRATLKQQALDILASSSGRSGKKDAFNADLDAAVRELIARAPAAADPVALPTPK